MLFTNLPALRVRSGAANGILAGLTLFTVAASAALPFGPKAHGAALPPSQSVFERRIRPLLEAKDPSSCSECHLSGVDLKDYIRPTEVETFAALRAQGMLDLKRPEDSKILRFIRMSRPKTPLVTLKVRDAEYAGFRDWIVAATNNPGLIAASARPAAGMNRSGPSVPDAVIRHTRIDSVVASFERNVWSQEGRCMNCHEPGNRQNIEKYGPRVNWFVPDDPEATMRRLIAQGDVNVEKPEESLLLLKPLNKVPHGGGVKMLYGDAGYKLFRAWLEDYAKSVKGGYRATADLPPQTDEALVNMNTILNVNGGPADWADKLLRVDVYPWDEGRGDWAAKPIGTGERGMSAPRPGAPTSTNLIMFLVVPDAGPGSATPDQAARARTRLAPGARYLLRYYCDTAVKLDRDYRIATNSAEFYKGQQEFRARDWFGGWGKPVKVQVALVPLR